jgi:glycerophosphoryl diester phosphodiesterase
MPTHPFLASPAPLAFAHRGGTSTAPENTLPAFLAAAELGFTYMETDVHATRDGVLVAFHDPDLMRTCGVAARIADLDWADLARIRVAGSERIPRLDELLAALPRARWNIDCKSDGALAPLVAFLERGNHFDRVLVGSFSDSRLDHLRRRFGSDLCTSMGPRDVAALRLGRRVVSRNGLRADAVQIPLRQGPVRVLTAQLLRVAHENDLHVHVWTIDDAETMRSVLDMGVDGIMTDRPETLRKVMHERGAWR